ncbi:MAG: hypothetical protein JNL01_02565 [Bdellovibrionales bacterium]|nr:hypothetical protein [Bdellovibrionales bacterium]
MVKSRTQFPKPIGVVGTNPHADDREALEVPAPHEKAEVAAPAMPQNISEQYFWDYLVDEFSADSRVRLRPAREKDGERGVRVCTPKREYFLPYTWAPPTRSGQPSRFHEARDLLDQIRRHLEDL